MFTTKHNISSYIMTQPILMFRLDIPTKPRKNVPKIFSISIFCKCIDFFPMEVSNQMRENREGWMPQVINVKFVEKLQFIKDTT